jgi:hypothetical protein
MMTIGKVEILGDTLYAVEDLDEQLSFFKTLDEAIAYCDNEGYDWEIINE